jgi:hypothetical protein
MYSMVTARKSAPKRRLKERVKWKKVGDESLLLIPETGEFFKINGSGTLVFGLLDKGRPQAEIVKRLCAEFLVERKVAERDVQTFLKELKDKDIY